MRRSCTRWWRPVRVKGVRTRHPFFDPATHGFVRVAAATPAVSVADPERNVDATLDLARQADAEGVDLVVFPELGISSYAIDDLHLQDAILRAVDHALRRLAEESAGLRPVLLVGAPLVANGRLFNCAVVMARGEILGVVPKSYLPNYREYYEKRWFAPGVGIVGAEIAVAGTTVPFGTDLRFSATDLDGLDFFVEICEDLWSPTSPSSVGALAGALICANLSASNIVIGKARDRELLCAAQSMRTMSVYVYSAAGPGESTTDLAWDGQGMVHELGELLAHSERFGTEPELLVADVDAGRVRLERMRTGTFNDAVVANDHPERRFRHIRFTHSTVAPGTAADDLLRRPVARFPFVPADPERLDADCYEAFNIQVEGLVTRFRATGGDHLVIGVSGGLDSTHALIVAAKAFDRMGLDRAGILGFTMPGFATSDTTRNNAWTLMRALGVTAEEIDIRPAAHQVLADIGHPFARGEPTYDITFENVQAGLRTDELFRLANQRNGFVVGTGDLSELALGWCTYGVGDQMSHYGVNPGVPKTLIQHLIRWCVRTGQFDPETEPGPALDPRHRHLTRARSRPRGRRPRPPRAAEHRGADRPLRAARLLPPPHRPPGPGSVEGGVPGLARLAGRVRRRLARGVPRGRAQPVRPRRHPRLARGVPPPVLRVQPVQAIRHAQRTEGVRRRQPLAPRRLAGPVRRHRGAVPRRAGGQRPRRIEPRLTVLAPRRSVDERSTRGQNEG